MKKQPEFALQVLVCDYLKMQYPHVLFLSDTVAQVKLTIPQSVRNKRIQKEGFKCPDLMIFAMPGLFIELKTETPFKKDGITIKASQNDHLLHQWKTLNDLKAQGYAAYFAWNFEMAKELIDRYLRK